MATDLKNRYSDKDLAEFKVLISEKIEVAKSHLELLKSSYMNDGNNGTDDTSPTFKAFEEGSETMSKEANTQLAIRQEKFIRDLKNALLRIENKTYGVCRVTGKLINKERLKLVPHATLSIEAKISAKEQLSLISLNKEEVEFNNIFDENDISNQIEVLKSSLVELEKNYKLQTEIIANSNGVIGEISGRIGDVITPTVQCFCLTLT